MSLQHDVLGRDVFLATGARLAKPAFPKHRADRGSVRSCLQNHSFVQSFTHSFDCKAVTRNHFVCSFWAYPFRLRSGVCDVVMHNRGSGHCIAAHCIYSPRRRFAARLVSHVAKASPVDNFVRNSLEYISPVAGNRFGQFARIVVPPIVA